MEIQKRLQAIAEYIPSCHSIADIGTDHGHLPIYLMKRGDIGLVLATDVAEGPLLAAKKNIQKAGWDRHIECRLGNGIQVLKPGEVDGISIAGMGGALMIEILSANPVQVQTFQFMVFQPMTKAGRLRRYLYEIGWHIEKERLVAESDRLYGVILAKPGKIEVSYTDLVYEVGPYLQEARDPLLPRYYQMLIDGKRSAWEQLTKVDAERYKRQRLAAEIKLLEEWLWDFQ